MCDIAFTASDVESWSSPSLALLRLHTCREGGMGTMARNGRNWQESAGMGRNGQGGRSEPPKMSYLLYPACSGQRTSKMQTWKIRPMFDPSLFCAQTLHAQRFSLCFVFPESPTLSSSVLRTRQLTCNPSTISFCTAQATTKKGYCRLCILKHVLVCVSRC